MPPGAGVIVVPPQVCSTLGYCRGTHTIRGMLQSRCLPVGNDSSVPRHPLLGVNGVGTPCVQVVCGNLQSLLVKRSRHVMVQSMIQRNCSVGSTKTQLQIIVVPSVFFLFVLSFCLPLDYAAFVSDQRRIWALKSLSTFSTYTSWCNKRLYLCHLYSPYGAWVIMPIRKLHFSFIFLMYPTKCSKKMYGKGKIQSGKIQDK